NVRYTAEYKNSRTGLIRDVEVARRRGASAHRCRQAGYTSAVNRLRWRYNGWGRVLGQGWEKCNSNNCSRRITRVEKICILCIASGDAVDVHIIRANREAFKIGA